MQARTLVVVCAVLLLAGAVAAEGERSVVLSGGKTVFVTEAVVEGGMVYLTFASGQMQAYPVEEVDLAASGLLPDAPEADEAEAAKKPRSIADATAKTTDQASVKITDKDVGHVKAPPAEATEEEADEEDAAAAAALLIANLQRELRGSMVTLTGTVKNVGTKAVTAVTLRAEAKDREGGTAGSGTTTISDEVPPQGEVGFSLSFPFEGEIADIQIRAVAAVAAFDFSAAEPPGEEEAAQ
jgi:hypothetical protein